VKQRKGSLSFLFSFCGLVFVCGAAFLRRPLKFLCFRFDGDIREDCFCLFVLQGECGTDETQDVFFL
jgi:hypothetical protein